MGYILTFSPCHCLLKTLADHVLIEFPCNNMIFLCILCVLKLYRLGDRILVVFPVLSMESLSDVIAKLCSDIKLTLDRARRARSQHKEKFFSKDYSILGKTIGHYAHCFKSLGIKTNTEFKNIIGKNFKAPKVRDAVLELEAVEDEWTEFLAESEEMMGMSKESAALTKLGDKINLDYQLVDARTQK